MKKTIFVLSFILIFSAFTFAQYTNPDPDPTGSANRAAIENQRRDTATKTAQMENARPVMPKIKRWYGKLTEEQRELLKPTEQDFEAHSEFLKKSKTGLVKLFPNPNCSEFVINADDEKCLNALPIFGRGAFYSFRKKSHTAPFWWDIHFIDNNFAAAKINSAVIVDLGDMPLDSINLETLEIKNLKNLPLINIPGRSSKQKNNFNEIRANKYSSKVLARENTSYALRSVIYEGVRNPRAPRGYAELKFFYSDSITIFRVVKQNPDGSVILLWKELERKTG